MADTSHWTLQDFANAAGKRVEPYPTCAAPEPQRVCQGCGEDLRSRIAKTTGLPMLYCGNTCRTLAARRWRNGPDEAATLGLHRYSWD